MHVHCTASFLKWIYTRLMTGGSGVLLQLVWPLNFLQSCSGEYMANLSSTTPHVLPAQDGEAVQQSTLTMYDGDVDLGTCESFSTHQHA